MSETIRGTDLEQPACTATVCPYPSWLSSTGPGGLRMLGDIVYHREIGVIGVCSYGAVVAEGVARSVELARQVCNRTRCSLILVDPRGQETVPSVMDICCFLG